MNDKCAVLIALLTELFTELFTELLTELFTETTFQFRRWTIGNMLIIHLAIDYMLMSPITFAWYLYCSMIFI